MDEAERQELRALIGEQEVLLAAVAADPTLGGQVRSEYKQRHHEIRSRLAPLGRPCFCVYDSIEPWQYSPHADVQDELDRMRAPLADLLYQESTPWRLAVYRRNGDPDDLPFVNFALELGDEHFDVLEASLRAELAVRGTELLADRRKAHTFDCSGRRPRTTVFVHKIEEGASSVRVVLRVFWDTAPNHTIVLLHGYDKGADDTDRRERREAAAACEMLRDLGAQLADPARAEEAVATSWRI